ncbi:MAG: hypothetical protein E8D40_07745 [Nitrospira sp.]|jgi:environmental stress-induced protein Ves|nr:MAG: hypothetical protein E8D40_07745 [Nitrospira sp.]
MDKSFFPLEGGDMTVRYTEVPMKPHMETQTLEFSGDAAPATTCVHGRLIDDVLTKMGKRTGQVRCLECGTIFTDPYQGNK